MTCTTASYTEITVDSQYVSVELVFKLLIYWELKVGCGGWILTTDLWVMGSAQESGEVGILTGFPKCA